MMSDPTEFIRAVMPYSRKMFAVAYRFLQRADEAEDVVQDILVKLWQLRDYLPPDNQLEPYILALTRNLSIDRFRSRHVADEEDFPAEEGIEDEWVENTDRLKLTLGLMKQLPDDQRKVLHLKVFEELSNEQIGNLLKLKPDNVRQLLSRARRKLKELAQKQGVI